LDYFANFKIYKCQAFPKVGDAKPPFRLKCTKHHIPTETAPPEAVQFGQLAQTSHTTATNTTHVNHGLPTNDSQQHVLINLVAKEEETFPVGPIVRAAFANRQFRKIAERAIFRKSFARRTHQQGQVRQVPCFLRILEWQRTQGAHIQPARGIYETRAVSRLELVDCNPVSLMSFFFRKHYELTKAILNCVDSRLRIELETEAIELDRKMQQRSNQISKLKNHRNLAVSVAFDKRKQK
jgi:hypothetical protein